MNVWTLSGVGAGQEVFKILRVLRDIPWNIPQETSHGINPTGHPMEYPKGYGIHLVSFLCALYDVFVAACRNRDLACRVDVVEGRGGGKRF